MENNIKKFTIIGGISFILHAIIQLFTASSISFADICSIIIFVLFGIMMFLQKKNTTLVVISAFDVIFGSYWLLTVPKMFLGMVIQFNLSDVFKVVILFIIILFNCIPSLSNKAETINKLYFVPALLAFFRYMIPFILLPDGNSITEFISLDLVYPIPEIVALLFMGLWFKKANGLSLAEETTQSNKDNEEIKTST